MRIEIELDEIEPPGGRVSADDRPPVAFSGWLGLLGELERALASAKLAARHRSGQLDP